MRLLSGTTGTPPPTGSTTNPTVPAPDYFSLWPDAETIAQHLAELQEFGFGPIALGDLAELCADHVVAFRCGRPTGKTTEELEECCGGTESIAVLYLVTDAAGLWQLGENGESIARLFTADGPPPAGVDAAALEEQIGQERAWVQSQLEAGC
jgi:hypothetical protein